MKRFPILWWMLCLPVPLLPQTVRSDSGQSALRPAIDSGRAAPAPDPAAYLRRQTPGPVPGSAVPGMPAPTGRIQWVAAQNQPVLTPTGFQNNPNVGTNVTFTPKSEKKRRRDD